MKNLKPSLADKFWSIRKGNMTYGETCLQLRLSAAAGKLWRVNKLIDNLRKTDNKHAEDEIGIAMTNAAKNGQTNIVQLMLDKNCGEGSYKKTETQPRFCNPAAAKLYKIKKELIERSATTKQASPEVGVNENWDELTWQERAFCIAVTSDYKDTAECLLNHGVDINILDGYAVCISAKHDYEDVFCMLIEKGADISARNYDVFYSAVFMTSETYIPKYDDPNISRRLNIDVLVEQNIDIPKKEMENILDVALYENIMTAPTVKKLLDFAEKMSQKPCITEFLELPHVKNHSEISTLLESYQKKVETISKRPKKSTGSPKK